MRFMCHGRLRPHLGEEGQARAAVVFRKWQPPKNVEIHFRYVAPNGHDFVLVEAPSVEDLIEATANWFPFIDYEIHPVTEAESGVPRMEKAVAERATMT